jgi:hypothetical protein
VMSGKEVVDGDGVRRPVSGTSRRAGRRPPQVLWVSQFQILCWIDLSSIHNFFRRCEKRKNQMCMLRTQIHITPLFSLLTTVMIC